MAGFRRSLQRRPPHLLSSSYCLRLLQCSIVSRPRYHRVVGACAAPGVRRKELGSVPSSDASTGILDLQGRTDQLGLHNSRLFVRTLVRLSVFVSWWQEFRHKGTKTQSRTKEKFSFTCCWTALELLCIIARVSVALRKLPCIVRIRSTIRKRRSLTRFKRQIPGAGKIH